MSSKKNLKRFIFFRITLLAFCMSLLLSYQGTQFFLHGFDVEIAWHMKQAHEYLADDKATPKKVLGYDVAERWEDVPEQVRLIFSSPPEQPWQMLKHFQNWWYFAPPEAGYFLMLTHNEAGEKRFISHVREFRKKPKKIADFVPIKRKSSIDPMVEIALWGLGSMLVFIAVLYWTFRSLSSPARALYNWAGALEFETAKETLPDFQYQELDELAEIIRSSMENAGKALEREKAFLSYASHELRTPITTLRSNATLLDKISPDPSQKEREVRDRILRSSFAMKGITETLLWLNRENQEPLPETEIDLEKMIVEIVETLEHLLEGKHVQVRIETNAYVQNLAEAPFQILLTNIIKNAFQHTESGLVTIWQHQSEICVSNPVHEMRGAQGVGFGLGVKLIRKLSEYFYWKLLITHSKTEYKVSVDVSNNM